jgi:hypothetical protein
VICGIAVAAFIPTLIYAIKFFGQNLH